jgi:GWxTD domain-containing protein
MKASITVTVTAIGLIASSLFAANLGKYRDWPNSPQGYFMTNAERADWSKLTSEAGAAQFVNKFIASRGPRFADEVDAAAKAADDHLSVAGKPGSKTLRGKIVIVLGPPSNFAIEQTRRDKSVPIASHVSTWRPQTVEVEPRTAAPLSEMRAKYVNDYTFTYAKEKLPGKAAKDRIIVVAVNPATGEDRILDARIAREVNELLEAAAQERASTAKIITP